MRYGDSSLLRGVTARLDEAFARSIAIFLNGKFARSAAKIISSEDAVSVLTRVFFQQLIKPTNRNPLMKINRGSILYFGVC